MCNQVEHGWVLDTNDMEAVESVNPARGRLHSVSGCPVLIALPLVGEWDRCWDWHETFHFPLSEWSNTGTGNSALIHGLLLVRWIQKLMDALRLCFSRLPNTYFRRNALSLRFLPIKGEVTLTRGNLFSPHLSRCNPISKGSVWRALRLQCGAMIWSEEKQDFCLLFRPWTFFPDRARIPELRSKCGTVPIVCCSG